MKKITIQIFVITLCAVFSYTVLGQSKDKPVYYFNPQWSPDGSSIVFESTRDGKSSIYTIASDGSSLKKITDTTFHYGQPAWSPDGKHLVYYGGSLPMQLFISSSKGGEQKQLPTPGYDAYEPVWSSQNVLAFNSRATGQTPHDIAIMNTDGTGFTKLTHDEKYDCASPQWSPDGKKILFQRSIAIRKPWKEITKEEREQKNKSTEIMTMNADGSDSRLILSNLGGKVAPFWSRDVKTIYYITKQDTAPVLYKLKTGEDKPETVLTLSGVIFNVSISPDEKYITYAAEREKKYAIYIQDIKKKTERKLIGD